MSHRCQHQYQNLGQDTVYDDDDNSSRSSVFSQRQQIQQQQERGSPYLDHLRANSLPFLVSPLEKRFIHAPVTQSPPVVPDIEHFRRKSCGQRAETRCLATVGVFTMKRERGEEMLLFRLSTQKEKRLQKQHLSNSWFRQTSLKIQSHTMP